MPSLASLCLLVFLGRPSGLWAVSRPPDSVYASCLSGCVLTGTQPPSLPGDLDHTFGGFLPRTPKRGPHLTYESSSDSCSYLHSALG